jgi:hypothetical protein
MEESNKLSFSGTTTGTYKCNNVAVNIIKVHNNVLMRYTWHQHDIIYIILNFSSNSLLNSLASVYTISIM